MMEYRVPIPLDSSLMATYSDSVMDHRGPQVISVMANSASEAKDIAYAVAAREGNRFIMEMLCDKIERKCEAACSAHIAIRDAELLALLPHEALLPHSNAKAIMQIYRQYGKPQLQMWYKGTR